MRQHIIDYLPWVVSIMSIYAIKIIGDKRQSGWKLSLFNSALWLVWIIATQHWGILLLNIAHWIMCIRNIRKWK